MDFSRRDVPSADSIDLDELTEQFGGPLWLPTGEELNVGENSWSSGHGVVHVSLVTTGTSGTFRRIEHFRRAPGLQHLESAARDTCLDNRRDVHDLVSPRLPDDWASASITFDGEEVVGHALRWQPVTLALARTGPIVVVIGTLEGEAPIRSLVRGRGRHPIRIPPTLRPPGAA